MSRQTPSGTQSGAPGSVPVERPTLNRRLFEKPVILSDSSDEASVKPTSAGDSGAVVVETPASSTIKPTPRPSTAEVGTSGRDSEAVDRPRDFPAGPQARPSSMDAAWGPIVEEGLRSVETVAKPVTAEQVANVSEAPELVGPDSSIGEPAVLSSALYGPISADWPAFPRREGTFTFDDLVALGRPVARRVDTFTQTDATWAMSVRERFLCNHWLAYQVPASLPCDRSMVLNPYDGLYLEGMVDFLTGKHHLPAAADPRLWVFDLPTPTQAGKRSTYDMMRTQWTVSYGFGRVITFAEHDAFRVNESSAARYDVIVEACDKRTQYRIPLEKIPALPSWIRELQLPGGLCIRLPRSLLYFGSEAERPDRFARYSSRLSYAVMWELARALASALDLDYYHLQIVWVLSDSSVAFLKEFSPTPKVERPAVGSHQAALRGISDTVELCEAARALPDEYLFERLHVPSGEWVRWAFSTSAGFVTTQLYSGSRCGGRAVLGGRSRVPREPLAPIMKEDVGGFGGAERRAPPGRKSSTDRHANLSSLLTDKEVRNARRFGVLIKDRSVRKGGWTVREILSEAMDRIEAAERASRSAEDRAKSLANQLASAQRQVDVWREHSERVSRPYSNIQDPYAQRGECPRSTASEERILDPYGTDAKRSRYSYYDPYDRNTNQGGAGPSVPTATVSDDPYAARMLNPYANNPYEPSAPSGGQNPYYRSRK